MVLDPILSGIAIKTEINMMKTSLTRKALVNHAVGLRARIERAPQRRAQRTMEAGNLLITVHDSSQILKLTTFYILRL